MIFAILVNVYFHKKSRANITLDKDKPMVYSITMNPIELKKWRAKNDWSQGQLAAVLKVSIQTISRWERGTREIPSFLSLALQLLEIKEDDLKPKTKRRKLRGGMKNGNDL
jgi:DNA-binding transcriptional regulator YiaG